MQARLPIALAGLALAMVPGPGRAQDTGPATHVMRAGETLHGLAARWLVRPAAAVEVQRMNRIANDRRIPVGTPIRIPRHLLKSEPVALRIAAFSGPVSHGLPSRMVAASLGAVLPEGSEVATGAGGFVTLATPDGSRLSLPSNSRVRLTASRRYLIDGTVDFDVEVLSGKAEAKAAPQKPGNGFRLRTPVAVTAVRGTGFRVGWTGEQGTSLTEVTEGEVGVATPAASLGLPAGFGVAARAGEGLSRETLLPAPDAIDPGKVQTDENLRFALRPVAGAASYRVRIGRDAGMIDMLAEASGSTPEIDLPGIGNGTFFLSATATAQSGLEGLAQAWSFRRQRLGVAADAGASAIPGGLRFNWLASGEGRMTHRFQLFPASEGAAALVDRPGLAEPGLTLANLAPGAYRWRVGVTSTTPEGAAEVWTPFQTLTISR